MMSTKIAINPLFGYLKGFIEAIPTIYSKGTVIYSARNELVRFKTNDLSLIIKKYKVPHPINRFVYSTLRRSKAERAYQYALKLTQLGIETATPIAYIETYEQGLLATAYFVSLEIPYAYNFREFWQGGIDGRTDVLDAFVHFMVKLHKQGVVHQDLTAGNVLYEKIGTEYHFSLVDINRMKFHKELSQQQCIQNFDRICTDFSVLAYIVQQYASIRKWDVDEMVQRAEHEMRQQFERRKKKNNVKRFLRKTQ